MLAAPTLACAQNLVETIALVKPSIVAVGTYQETRTPKFLFYGTGFAVADGRHVATNAHVLPRALERNEKLVVALPLAERQVEIVKAERVLDDGSHDLTLLRIAMQLPALALGESDKVREGQALAFTGFPLGGAIGLSPTTHRAHVAAIAPFALPVSHVQQLSGEAVRAMRRDPFPIFQLDATAYPGNSGSPLYDAVTGEVVGILNMVFVKSAREAAMAQPSGITYAIPAENLRRLIQQLPR